MADYSEKEVSVREATLLALESSQAGLKEIKELFVKAAGHFDSGNDKDGLLLLSNEAIPRVKAFFGFCKSLVDANADVISLPGAKRLAVLFIRSDTVMKSLFKETEEKNYTEVGDLLRFDFADLLSEYAAILPELASDFKRSVKKGLDKH